MSGQPPLLRRLGLASAAALVVSNMIGTGVFSTTGFLAGDLGRPSLVISIWAAGAFCALLGALCYSELAINFPVSGGEYVYLSQAYGPTWGFISGWVSLFAGFSAPIAAAALSCAAYIAFFVPSWWPQWIATALVLFFATWNLFGIRLAARLQNLLTGLKIALLIAFVACGLAFGNGDWLNFEHPAHRWSATPLWEQFAVSLFWIYVAYSGWNAAVYVAEEIKNPKRTLPLAMLVGASVVAVLYVALNVAFLYAVPLQSMQGVIAIGALAATHLFGAGVAGLFSALMAFGLLSTVNAMTIAGPRVYYAMARNGHFPRWAAAVHSRWRTPVAAILAQAACTLVLLATPFPQLVVYIGFTLNLFAVLSVASLFLFRRRPGWRTLKAVSFAYPLIPCLFIAIGMWMTIEGILQQPLVSLQAALTLASGALLYRWSRQKSPSRT